MSMDVATPTRPVALPSKSTWIAVVVLGRREARRMLRSPIYVGILAIFLVEVGLGNRVGHDRIIDHRG